MSRPTFVTIDLPALQFNLQRVKQYAPSQRVMAMVKANAYGHGIEVVAHALDQADAFGVASLEEGVSLREAGIKQPIILVEGLFYPSEMKDAAHYQFTLVVRHLPQVEMLERASAEIPAFPIWLKINTGMNRLGVAVNDVPAVYARLLKANVVQKPIGLMTHFAESEADDRRSMLQQLALFKEVTQDWAGPSSLANSAAIMAAPETHGDWVRPGLMLYGASPIPGRNGLDELFRPVMTLSSQLIAIQRVKKGDHVGYGSRWVAPHACAIGIVAMGYGDGYPRQAEDGTPILVNGIECALAGRVSMDMLAVDLSHVPTAKVGDPVILWGKGLPVERVAVCSHTSAYELLTRMTPRPKVRIEG